MAHVAKYTKVSSGKLMKHYERAVDKDGKHINYGNIDIDLERTHLNYNLAPERTSQYERMQERLDQVYVFNRKDVNVMADWVVTLPSDFPKEKTKDFFKESYNFLSDRYGEDNVISSYVHMDETTPHMHFSFVPVVDDPKKGLKVNAKQCLSKLELKQFHQQFDKRMNQSFGFDVGILNGATQEGNKSIEELKRGTAIKELDALKKQYKALKRSLSKIMDVRDQVESINSLEGEIKGLKKDKVVLKLEDYEKMKEIAKLSYLLESNLKTQEGNMIKLSKKISKLEKTNDKLISVNETLNMHYKDALKIVKYLEQNEPGVYENLKGVLHPSKTKVNEQEKVRAAKSMALDDEMEL